MINYYMEGRIIPYANVLLTYTQKEIISFLTQFKRENEKLLNFEVEGPYVIHGCKPGECFEGIEPDGHHHVGRADAYVCMTVNQTNRDQHFNPFEKNEKIKEGFSKLEDKLKINIIPSVVCARELDLYSPSVV